MASPANTPTPRAREARRDCGLQVVISVILFGAVVWLFAPARHYPFINFDDGDYVFLNPQVQSGLTWPNFVWAFKSGFASNWHPVTWLSLMMDCQIHGVDAGAYHFTNLVLHAVNSVLLFLVLRRMTGALWRSAAVAALFALHPLRLESVVWVSERKDLLCGLFWLLTMWMYVEYARSMERSARLGNYAAALLFFSLGLMSKPMIVTLPCVLMLLDFWPLGRVALMWGQLRARFVEKIPFFTLAAIFCVITVMVQTHARASFERLSLSARLANAVVSYQRYVRKIFWPVDLAVFYPHPGKWPVWYVVASLAVLVLISSMVARWSRTHFYLAVGWLWFLGVLLPVIGLLQAGSQSMADRFTYLPSVGVGMMLVWTVAELANKTMLRRNIGAAFLAILVLFCAWSTRAQLAFWRDDETLYTHAIAVTGGNSVAYINRGYGFATQERYAEAIADFESVLRSVPDCADALANRGTAYAKQGLKEKALNDYSMALRSSPTQAGANNGLGRLLEQAGQYDMAIPYFQRALAAKPNFPEAEDNWGYALAGKGDVAGAILHYEKALRIDPKNAEAHNNLGVALAQLNRLQEATMHVARSLKLNAHDAQAQNNYANLLAEAGRLEEAVVHYQQSLKLKPDYLNAHSNLGRILARQKKWNQAIAQFEAACKIDRSDTEVMDGLARAYAHAGRYPEAIAMAGKAVQLCEKSGQTKEAQTLREHVALYQRGEAGE